MHTVWPTENQPDEKFTTPGSYWSPGVFGTKLLREVLQLGFPPMTDCRSKGLMAVAPRIMASCRKFESIGWMDGKAANLMMD